MNTVFVTGATGVLGRPVVRSLIAAGHDVRALARSDRNVADLEEAGATPVHADLFDAWSLSDAIAGCDAILHLATRIPPTSEMRRREAWAENDRIRREGTRALVDAALAGGEVTTFVYPGVAFVYAHSGDRWIDSANGAIQPDHPVCTTVEAEAEVARFAMAGEGRRGISLRLGAFYGPASPDSRQALAMARKGLAMPIAPTDAYKSLIWIDDAASAVVSALERAPSGVFDVAEDEPFTQGDAARALASAVGRGGLTRLPRWMLRFAVDRPVRDLLARSQRVRNERFKQATGWRPEVPNQAEGWRRIAATSAESSVA